MESCPTQAVLPLVGLAADKLIRHRYKPSWLNWIAGSTTPWPILPRKRGVSPFPRQAGSFRAWTSVRIRVKSGSSISSDAAAAFSAA
ncbi:MAG: hypothetical protein ACQESR_09300 [Planctomycetota bacterium]